ncbi:HD domain-containing protein [Piscibacillus salipiscarius]|nr:HD domain-containing protein [Piscibacillus salipiscarius]
MKRVTLEDIYVHPIVQKYVRRSGMAHAISVAHKAYELATKYNVNPELAVKAGFLHDIGHYTWYNKGEWDYEQYKACDIHPIKGAERAHKLLVRLGEDKQAAKEIAHAILFHTESALPSGDFNRSPLQEVVHLADELDKQPNDAHHYEQINHQEELKQIRQLDDQLSHTNV